MMPRNNKSLASASTAITTTLAAILLASKLVGAATQLSASMDNDLSRPTYGFSGPSSSQVTYDERNGLNLRGAINDVLGPPIKIANGFNNMLLGSNMAGMGTSLKTGGAILGIDAKLLEAAGGHHLLKGGLLMGGAAATKGIATALEGAEGKKIASVIEVPVKVVAMKDLATGKVLGGMGKVKEVEALAAKAKGAGMIKEGEQLKAQGMSQVMQGATEGMTNIGNMVQQTANNAATAVKLLPLMFDLPTGQQQHQQQQQEQDSTKSGTQHAESSQHQLHQAGGTGTLTGGSLFGGLSSLLPGLTSSDPFAPMLGGSLGGGHNRSPFNMFGNQLNHNGYAAILNNSHPLTDLLANPGLNPFLYPLATGPLGQSVLSKPSMGTPSLWPSATSTGSSGFGLGQNGQSSTFNYNLFPGVKVSETTSSRLPLVPLLGQQQQHHLKQQIVEQHPQQQQQHVEQPQQQQQLVEPATKSA